MNLQMQNTQHDSVANTQLSSDSSELMFGFEEMLTELEAIVADAEIRLAEEATA